MGENASERGSERQTECERINSIGYVDLKKLKIYLAISVKKKKEKVAK
jgi:hypothetical protein